MRPLGLLLIFAAICLGLLWPWYQINFQGREVETLQFGNLQSTIVERQTITLTKQDNPVRVRFLASFLVGGKLPPIKLPIKVVITDREGTLLVGIVSFPTKGRTTGPELEPIRAGTLLNFSVLNDGEHEVFLELAPNENDGAILKPALSGVAATFVANAPALQDNFRFLAIVLALAGVYTVSYTHLTLPTTPYV